MEGARCFGPDGATIAIQAKLVVVGGEARASEFTINVPTVIGRSRSADLNLGNPLVSRQHCEIYEADGVLMVRDLGSLNGTFVGDTRIAEEAPLEPGDLLTIGATTFRAVYESSTATLAGTHDDTPDFELEVAEETHRAPAEIQQTIEADGLGLLEESREAAELQEAPAAEEDDYNFGFLEEGAEGEEELEVLDVAEDEELLELEVADVEAMDELEVAEELEELEVAELETIDELETAEKLEPVEELGAVEDVGEPLELEVADDMEVIDALESIPDESVTAEEVPQVGSNVNSKAAESRAPQVGSADEPQPAKANEDDLNEFFKNLG